MEDKIISNENINNKDFGVYSNVDGKEILTYAIQNKS